MVQFIFDDALLFVVNWWTARVRVRDGVTLRYGVRVRVRVRLGLGLGLGLGLVVRVRVRVKG
jgi:hypothetical protein